MSFLSISIVAVIYLISTWVISLLHPFPPFVYILSGGAAVISHSLVAFTRLRTDQFLNTREKRLRRGLLRYQNGDAGQDSHLGLARLLESICAPVQASFAILFVRQNEHFEALAAYRWSQAEVLLPAGALQADDVRLLRRGELPSPFEIARLLLPIYQADHQVGALLLGPAEHGLAYSPVDLGSLEDFSDYLGLWLGQASLPEVQDEPSSSPDMPPAPEDFMPSADQISSREVELGLRHLHDYATLAEMPLARLGCVAARSGRSGLHIETGKAVQAALREAMEKLRPLGESPEKRSHAPVPREWYPYIILRDAYLDSTPNREIMDRLYISEGTFNRTRRSAIRSVTMLLGEMESQLQNK